MRKPVLLTPGPTQVPEEVLASASLPIMHHRTPQFEAIFEEAAENLKYIFQTENPVIMLTSSGTGALESSVINLCSPGDKVIAVNGGKFGERWIELCKAFHLDLVEISIPWHRTVKPEEIEKALKENPDAKVVFTTLSETSSGGVTDIESIAKITRTSPALLVVDAVSGLGVTPLYTDKWGVDVVVSGSQKGFMLPPGLGFITMNERAQKAMESSTLPKYYFDLKKAYKNHAKNTTPWTPAISIIVQLNIALRMMKEEGIENIFTRHHKLSEAIREGVKALGLTLYNEDTGDCCIAVNVPDGVDGGKIVKLARDKYQVTFAGGQGDLKGKIFRISAMGNVGPNDVILGLATIERTLAELGYSFEKGKGISAAICSLSK
ncbi:MAG TPA: alanine--glyoxylate aminotransferase family protein [Caldisericia bacterium]|nr:alanine--glyoxylate aminotransferase family protein [Caldisericia bacterium]HXK51714.1 alanine--glyoxylate aminotransferase family protein [Caldisericia bacterium]